VDRSTSASISPRGNPPIAPDRASRAPRRPSPRRRRGRPAEAQPRNRDRARPAYPPCDGESGPICADRAEASKPRQGHVPSLDQHAAEARLGYARRMDATISPLWRAAPRPRRAERTPPASLLCVIPATGSWGDRIAQREEPGHGRVRIETTEAAQAMPSVAKSAWTAARRVPRCGPARHRAGGRRSRSIAAVGAGGRQAKSARRASAQASGVRKAATPAASEPSVVSAWGTMKAATAAAMAQSMIGRTGARAGTAPRRPTTATIDRTPARRACFERAVMNIRPGSPNVTSMRRPGRAGTPLAARRCSVAGRAPRHRRRARRAVDHHCPAAARRGDDAYAARVRHKRPPAMRREGARAASRTGRPGDAVRVRKARRGVRAEQRAGMETASLLPDGGAPSL